MDPVWLFLLSIAAIFLIGAIGEIIFQRTSIPDVVWLIAAGLVLGPTSGVLTREGLSAIAPYFAAITLVVVLFEGGSSLRLGDLSTAAPRSGALALVSFAAAALVITPASMLGRVVGILPDSWTWMHGLMLGCVLGGSSSIVIMPAVAQARLSPRLANLVNLESALTDALCVVGTVALIDIIVGRSAGNPAVTLLRSFGIGLGVGVVTGLVWLLFLRALKSSEHAYPITLSALMILYVVIDHLGGSAALGILAVAVMLGNARSLGNWIGLAEDVELDGSVRGFHTQMAFIVKSFFFVFIGAMLRPPWLPLLFGVALAGLLYASRIPAVRVATVGGDFSAPERKMITVSMPRGMAAGVLATLPMAKGVAGTEQLPVTVFATVVTMVLVFAIGFPIAKRQLPKEPSDTASAERLPLPAGAARPSTPPEAGPAAKGVPTGEAPPTGETPPAQEVGESTTATPGTPEADP